MKFRANKKMIKEEKSQAVESIGAFLRFPFSRCVLSYPDFISTCLAKLAFNIAAKQVLITGLWLLLSRRFYWTDIIACSVEADACIKIWTFLNFGVKHSTRSNCVLKNGKKSSHSCGLVAKWIRCLTTDQKIPGSNPGGVEVLLRKTWNTRILVTR